MQVRPISAASKSLSKFLGVFTLDHRDEKGLVVRHLPNYIRTVGRILRSLGLASNSCAS